MAPAGTGRVLFLCADPQLVQAQLQGTPITRAQAGALRDDISTDEITPLSTMTVWDERLGRVPYTGLKVGGRLPIVRDAVKDGSFTVIVAGRRYGKGSSREHSPLAELSAGVRLVIAESFERIYRQNADNLGLFTSTDLGLVPRLQRGEALTQDELLAGRDPQAAAILRAGGLLAYGSGPEGDAPRPAPGPKTLFHKIVERHALKPGFVRADRRFIHEIYTGMCAQLLQQRFGDGYALHDPASIVCFEDHHAYVERSPVHVANGLVASVHKLAQAHRDFVARHGLTDHGLAADGAGGDLGAEGISHALMAERYALPGELIVGTDSHTPHSGALGCVAFGVGTTDMANAFMTGAVRAGAPEVLRIEVDGALAPGVSAKDLVLHLLALPPIRAGAGVGRVFEFGGAAVRALDIDERATLTNMVAELGGFTGLVEPDEVTVQFLRERRGIDFRIEPWMRSDEGAPYAEVMRIDASALSTMVTRPGDPGLGLPLRDLAERPRLDIAYGGSCTAGKREDFDRYHEVLAWGLGHGLAVPAHVQVFLQYGTTAVRDYCVGRGYDRVFARIGARILQPSCGACANCGPGVSTDAGQVTVSAINRNFPGRSGPGQVWLASPATVMASALAGELCSFGTLRARVARR